MVQDTILGTLQNSCFKAISKPDLDPFSILKEINSDISKKKK